MGALRDLQSILVWTQPRGEQVNKNPAMSVLFSASELPYSRGKKGRGKSERDVPSLIHVPEGLQWPHCQLLHSA